MGFAPRLDSLAVFRPAEVTLVLRLLQPAALRFDFALLAARRLRAVALMVAIAVIGSEQLFAMVAFALGGGISSPDSKNGAGPAASSSVGAMKIGAPDKQMESLRTNLRKVFCEV
jgi:hypothetical protein